MNAGVIKHPLAVFDLEECSEYLRQHNPHGALRFLQKAEITFQYLAEMPGMGAVYDSPRTALAGLRFFPISGFEKYLVFYRPAKEGIDIIHIYHSTRDIKDLLTN